MITENDRPGEWPDLSAPGKYRRLVRLAERRLGSHTHLAEDVVSRAVIRWAQLPATTSGRARLEQIIMSESYSALRSELRLKERERRAERDPSRCRPHSAPLDEETILLRTMLQALLARHGSTLTEVDLDILEHLCAGISSAEICRMTGYSKYCVTTSRSMWRTVLATMTQQRAAGTAEPAA